MRSTHYRVQLRSIVILLALASLLLNSAPRPAYAQTNLLTNPGFEDGWYHWNWTPELAIPNGWDFWWADSSWPMLDPQDHPWGRPETVTWLYPPGFAESYLWRDGQYTLKVFGAWRPIWFRLSQTVTGLTPGASYQFTVPVYPELVAEYDPKVYSGESSAGEHRLVARTGGQTYATNWLDGNSVPYGQWSLLNLTFVAQGTSATVEIEIRGRWGLINNAFFIDQLSLTPVSSATQPTATSAPTNTPQPTTTTAPPTNAPASAPTSAPPTSAPASAPTSAPPNTAIPAATQAPTATAATTTQSDYILYTVQRGDTLYRIASKHGVTMDAIAALNGITNYRLVYAGATLRIPASNGSQTSTTGSQAAPSSSSSSPQTTQPTTSTTTAPTTYVVQRGDTLATIGRKFGLSATVLASANGLNNVNLIYAGQVLTIPERSRYYTVRAGDTLASIATRFGVTTDVLVTANRLRNPNVIYRGQPLVIP